jgi:aldehyde dehydrogenase (NAD+)
VWGKCLNAGQTCIAPDYLLVQRGVAQPLIQKLGERIGQCFGPDPLASPDLASIVNAAQFARLQQLLQGAQQRGQVLFGGQCDAASRRLAPTLIRVDTFEDPLMAEELFGPLLPVLEVDDLAQAMAWINGRPKPLALYLFSTSGDAQRQLLEGTSSGGVCINDVVMQVSVPELPFGGVGNSGMGAYHGEAGFLTFSHRRSVLRRPFQLDVPLRYPPYGQRLPLIRQLLR